MLWASPMSMLLSDTSHCFAGWMSHAISLDDLPGSELGDWLVEFHTRAGSCGHSTRNSPDSVCGIDQAIDAPAPQFRAAALGR